MKLKFSLLFIISSALMITSCTKDDTSNDATASAKRIGQTNAYNIVHDNENRNLEVYIDKQGSVYTTHFTYRNTKDDVTLFSLEYSFDNSEEGWKYGEQRKALNFAAELNEIKLSKAEMKKLDFMLDEGYQEYIHEITKNGLDLTLYSGISYLKSAVAANLRAIANNSSVITGTLSPTFLVDRTFFMFQEDLKVNIDPLKANIDLLQEEANNYNFESDLNMVNFIRETGKKQITYDELYSFYVDKDDYYNFIENSVTVMHADDCSGWCLIGCGSDWGCCGNYTGCCVFSSATCLAHDLACTECKPAWFCLSGCVPDYGNNRVVRIIMAP